VAAPDTPTPGGDPPPTPAQPKPATLPQVMSAVFWSFFGVRRGAHMQRDAVTVKPLQVIVIGVLFAAVLVLVLLALVRVILRSAG
jgi:amino acid transporter